VSYKQVVMHRDIDEEIARCLEGAFAVGSLTGKRPSMFPECYVCIMFEYMDHGTLQDLMDVRCVTPESVAAVLRQAAKALAFLHSKQHIHGNIRPESVLLQKHAGGDDLVVKLADFGLATCLRGVQHDCELLGYLAWCAALDRPFQRCPEPRGQASAVAEFFCAGTGKLWEALGGTVRRLWSGALSMADVAGMEVLQGHEVRVPRSAVLHLENRAKESLKRREMSKEGLLRRQRTLE